MLRPSHKPRFLVLALVLLAGVTSSCNSLSTERFFRYVDGSPRATSILAETREAGGGGDFILVQETNRWGRPIASDTLRVWVQHYGPNGTLYAEAEEANLLIACHPELMPEAMRERHVLPRESGPIRCGDYVRSGLLRVFTDPADRDSVALPPGVSVAR